MLVISKFSAYSNISAGTRDGRIIMMVRILPDVDNVERGIC
jgi:hypothetical protein